SMWRFAKEHPEEFWREQAERFLSWDQPFEKTLEWQDLRARWFVGGQLNVAANCLDRHLQERGDQVAIHWEGEPGDDRRLTYRQLHEEVCRCANVLEEFGIQAGDFVTIYMPLIPEAVIAMLACARIGAPHNVVFGGFS